MIYSGTQRRQVEITILRASLFVKFVKSGTWRPHVMIGAIFMVHLENGWSFMNNGMEFQVVLLLMALYFIVAGNNKPSESIPA